MAPDCYVHEETGAKGTRLMLPVINAQGGKLPVVFAVLADKSQFLSTLADLRTRMEAVPVHEGPASGVIVFQGTGITGGDWEMGSPLSAIHWPGGRGRLYLNIPLLLKEGISAQRVPSGRNIENCTRDIVADRAKALRSSLQPV